MSLGIIVSDTIVSTVEVGVAVYNEILGDPANDPEIVANTRRDMKRTRRRIPQSLVRRVAQTLPLKPEPRLKIPITRFQEEYGISVSNNGKYSVSPFEDTSWLYEEEGHINSSYRTHKWTPNPYPKDFIQRWELRPPRERSRHGSNCEDLDSGLDSVSVCTKTSEVAEERVAALENELASLKAMMASIALAQMQPTAASTPAADKTAARTPAAPPAPPVPAPPPPPAPPSSAPGFKPSVPPSQKSNKLPEIKENKVTEQRPGDMTDVLKDVGKQKALLKSVEKSPGGTPIRRQPKPCNPSDPSTILANALKQKFANTPTTLNESTDCEKSFNDSQTT